jgi:hypothetical protein
MQSGKMQSGKMFGGADRFYPNIACIRKKLNFSTPITTHVATNDRNAAVGQYFFCQQNIPLPDQKPI